MDHTVARPRFYVPILALLALAALAWGSIVTVLPPAPVPASAPADRFSAERAFEHVEVAGARVHVAGSGPAATLQSYLEDRLLRLGLETEVQEAVGGVAAFGGDFAMARVHNVIGVLPGTEPTGRLFLVAHYDSVQVSYGANDDGAGVATLLETARALASGPRPRNDVVFVFTDAEEACLCGAEAFVSQHPLAAGGGVVMNFEARGSSGPVVMFETTEGNADVVAVYAAHAAHPVASSFAVEVYRILPNDTDFSPFRDAGRFTGLNAAYIDGSAAYHTPQDTPSTMDRGSLQQHGDNALALTRAFADADLAALAEPSGGDLTYFPVFGLLVRYPGGLVWPIAALALVAVGVLAFLVRRRLGPPPGMAAAGRPTWTRLLGGVGLGLVPLLLGPVLAQALWALLVAIRPGYGPMADPWQPGLFRAGVVALTVAVLLTWYGLLRRRLGAWPLVIGALTWLALLGLVLAALTPGGSYFAALPALAVALALVASLFIPRPWVAMAVVALGAAVAVIVLAPLIVLFFPALGLATAGAGALLAMLVGFALLPVLAHLYPPLPQPTATTDSALWTVDPVRRRLLSSLPAAVAGLLVVAFVGAGLATDGFDEDHPSPAHLMYVLDADTGQARWVSEETSPTGWTAQYITGPEDLSEAFPLLGAGLSTGPAPTADLRAPEVAISTTPGADGQRTIEVVIVPQRAVRLVAVRLSGATIVGASADGRSLPADQLGRDSLDLQFHAPPAEGLTIRFTVSEPGPLTLRVMDGSDGLDGLPGFTPRPPGVGIEGSHDSELVLVAQTYRF